MGVETFQYIDDLVATNPTATDNVSEGDDHIRGIKTTLKNTLPNVTGAITSTQAELNLLDGKTTVLGNVSEDTTPQLGGDLDTNGSNINFGDNDKAQFGATNDLQIYNNSIHSYIREVGSGSLYLQGTNLILEDPDSNDYVHCRDGSSVGIFYNGSEKLTTTSTGIDVTGTITADGLDMDDNHYIKLGTGDDLQIYHDGGNSVIRDSGTGDLYIQGDNILRLTNVGASEHYAKFNQNGAVQLYYDNAEKLATTSTGIDVTGNITADGIDVTTNAAGDADTITLNNFTGNSNVIRTGRGLVLSSDYDDNSGNTQSFIRFDIDNTKCAKIDSTGDISFYEDTGTTAKFFWDASAEHLGIGTSSPSAELDIVGNATDAQIEVGNNLGQKLTITGGSSGIDFTTANALAMTFGTSGLERMRIDSSGRVGIGTSSPASKVHINTGTYGEALRFQASSETSGYYTFGMASGGALALSRMGTEQMRIDSSGNVGIGTSSPSSPLHISGIGAGYSKLQITETDTSTDFVTVVNGGVGYVGMQTNDPVAFITNDAERMRIDSAGNVGIGTTSPDQLLHIYGSDCAIKFDNQDGSPTDQSVILRHEPIDADLPGAITSGLILENSSTSNTNIVGFAADWIGFTQNNTSLSGIISGVSGSLTTGNSASSYNTYTYGGVTHYISTHSVTTGKTFVSTPDYFITMIGNNASGHTSITNTYIRNKSTTGFDIIVADREGSSGIYFNWLALNTG